MKKIKNENSSKVVFDLRGNRGGNPECTRHILSYIIDKKYDFYQSLNKIKDIEKYTTKLKLYKLNPNEIYHIYNSIVTFEEVFEEIKTDNKAQTIYHTQSFHKSYINFKKYLQSTFNINNCQYCITKI